MGCSNNPLINTPNENAKCQIIFELGSPCEVKCTHCDKIKEK